MGGGRPTRRAAGGGHALRRGGRLGREPSGHLGSRHRPGARPRHPDPGRRALQPAGAAVELHGGADPRPGERGGPGSRHHRRPRGRPAHPPAARGDGRGDGGRADAGSPHARSTAARSRPSPPARPRLASSAATWRCSPTDAASSLDPALRADGAAQLAPARPVGRGARAARTAAGPVLTLRAEMVRLRHALEARPALAPLSRPVSAPEPPRHRRPGWSPCSTAARTGGRRGVHGAGAAGLDGARHRGDPRQPDDEDARVTARRRVGRRAARLRGRRRRHGPRHPDGGAAAAARRGRPGAPAWWPAWSCSTAPDGPHAPGAAVRPTATPRNL